MSKNAFFVWNQPTSYVPQPGDNKIPIGDATKVLLLGIVAEGNGLGAALEAALMFDDIKQRLADKRNGVPEDQLHQVSHFPLMITLAGLGAIAKATYDGAVGLVKKDGQ
jgi:hypothetical protein